MSTSEKIACVQLCICWTIWTAGRALPGVRASLHGCIPSLHPCRSEPIAMFSRHIILHTRLSFCQSPSRVLSVDNAIHIKLLLDALLHRPSVRNRHFTPNSPLQCHLTVCKSGLYAECGSKAVHAGLCLELCAAAISGASDQEGRGQEYILQNLHMGWEEVRACSLKSTGSECNSSATQNTSYPEDIAVP